MLHSWYPLLALCCDTRPPHARVLLAVSCPCRLPCHAAGVRLRPANGATRTTPGKPAQPATLAPIAPSALPADMVHLPSVSELRRLESAGTAVPRTIAATAPAADGSDAGVGVGGRDTHGNSPASADRPEVLQGPTGVIPANGGVPGNGAVGGTADGNGAGSAAWPKIQMTPIADPREVPAVKLPLLGRGAKRRGAPQLPPATPPEPRWLQSFNRIMNPPLAATSCGLVLGLSPLGATSLCHDASASGCFGFRTLHPGTFWRSCAVLWRAVRWC